MRHQRLGWSFRLIDQSVIPEVVEDNSFGQILAVAQIVGVHTQIDLANLATDDVGIFFMRKCKTSHHNTFSRGDRCLIPVPRSIRNRKVEPEIKQPMHALEREDDAILTNVFYANISLTTFPCTSVSRKCRP